MAARKFIYALEPLLVKQQWDVDDLAKELAAADAACKVAVREREEAFRRVKELESELIAARAEGATLNPQRDRLLVNFRAVRQTELDEAQLRVTKAEEQRDQIQSDLSAASARLKGYERHKERQRQDQAHEYGKQQEKLADDAWLTALAGKLGGAA